MRFVQIGLILAIVGLSACGEVRLRELRNPSEGPDEFKITPGLPLESPDDYAFLPEPTPGGSNLTDQLPLETSVAALGGRRTNSTTIPASDGGIVNYASRFGRDGTIRETLAAEDADFRKRRGRFTNIRIVRRDSYELVYRREVLDAFAEQRRWRAAGARTASAPPQE